jgi:hypothetical protein
MDVARRRLAGSLGFFAVLFSMQVGAQPGGIEASGGLGLQTPAFSPATGRMDPTTDPPQAEPVPVEREYDRFQDKTTIRVEGVRPAITKGDSRLFINATSSCDGPEVTGKPTKIQLNLLAVSDDYQYADLREGLELILLIDNKRVRVPAKFVKAGTTKDRNPRTLESFVSIIDAGVLSGMATANAVEGQLGGTEFKLGQMEQLSLRRFGETVNLVAPLPKPSAAALDAALAAGPVRGDAVAMHLAQAKVDEAQEKVDRLTAACLIKLEQSSEYQAAVKAARELETKKDQTPVGPQRTDVSQQWLEAKAKVGLIRSSALLEDTDLSAARRELSDAQQGLRTLQRVGERAHIGSASR